MWSRVSLCSKNKEVSTFVFYIHRNHIHFPKLLFKILKAQLPVQDNKSSPDYISFNSGSLRSSFHTAWAVHAHRLTSRGSIKTNAETRSVWVPFLPDRCGALTIGCRIYGFYCDLVLCVVWKIAERIFRLKIYTFCCILWNLQAAVFLISF